MVYPFSRFNGSPQTPQDLRQKRSSRLSYRPRTSSHFDAFTPRVALLTGAIFGFLLLSYILHAVFKTSRTHHDRLAILGDLHQEQGFHQFIKGCHYRWYNTEEICMILERFDGVVFIGDDMVRQIYAAFNILLQENIAMGGLEHSRMSDVERHSCRCENQLMKPECQGFSILGSHEISGNDATGGPPSSCKRTPHFLLSITDTPTDEASHKRLSDLLAKDPNSYQAVPVILSLGLGGSLSWEAARRSMDEWLPIADTSLRNTPFLWVGPNAAGHLKPPGKILQEGNNALWHYTAELGKEARARGMETLGLYNMTIQASSWDGTNYGLRVNLAQAMMIINWLSRLE